MRRPPKALCTTCWIAFGTQGSDRDFLGLVDLAGGIQLDVLGRRLDLDDVGTELAGDLRGIGDDVDSGLALLGDAGAAGVGPDDNRETGVLGLLGEGAQLHVHLVASRRSRGRS